MEMDQKPQYSRNSGLASVPGSGLCYILDKYAQYKMHSTKQNITTGFQLTNIGG
jgi:hypothetical protein